MDFTRPNEKSAHVRLYSWPASRGAIGVKTTTAAGVRNKDVVARIYIYGGALGMIELPVPATVVPDVVSNVPLFSNFWMRSLPLSATNTFPSHFAAAARGGRGPAARQHAQRAGEGNDHEHSVTSNNAAPE